MLNVEKKRVFQRLILFVVFISSFFPLPVGSITNQWEIDGKIEQAGREIQLILEGVRPNKASESMNIIIDLPKEVIWIEESEFQYEPSSHTIIHTITDKEQSQMTYRIEKKLLLKEMENISLDFQVSLEDENERYHTQEIQLFFQADEVQAEGTTEPITETNQEESVNVDDPLTSAPNQEPIIEDSGEKTTESETSPLETAPHVNVSNWEELNNAYQNEHIQSITLLNSIEEPPNANKDKQIVRKHSITIDGNFHSLRFKEGGFLIDPSQEGTFILKNFSSIGHRKSSTHTQDTPKSIISIPSDAKISQLPRLTSWTIEVHNINSLADNHSSLVNHPSGKLFLSGAIRWQTSEAVAIVNGVQVAEFSNVFIHKTSTDHHRPTPFFKFEKLTGSARGFGEFLIKKNALVSFTSENKSENYPIVSGYYDRIYLERQADLIGVLPGNVMRVDNQASHFVAEGENRIYLESTRKGIAPIVFNFPGDKKWLVGMDSQFVLKGDKVGALFEEQSQKTTLQFEKLKSFELNNRQANQGFIFSERLAKIESIATNLHLWRTGDNDHKETYATANLTDLIYEPQTRELVMNPEDPRLREYIQTARFHKIIGNNSQPLITIETPTTADNQIAVKISYESAISAVDETGNFVQEVSHFGLNKNTVTVEDSYGQRHSKQVDESGNVSFTFKELHQKNGEIKVSLKRGTQVVKEVRYPVVDVTPPDPVVFDKGQFLTTDSKKLSGTAEAGSQLFVYLNKQTTSITTRSDKQGKWQVSLKELDLKVGDKLHIQAFDNEQLNLEAIDAPVTYIEGKGNGNPLFEEVIYRSAIFPKASSLTVEGQLRIQQFPQTIDFGDQVVSTKEGRYWGTLDQAIVIEDSRKQTADWRLKLTTKNHPKNELYGLLYYKAFGQERMIDENGTIIPTLQMDEGTMYQTNFDNEKTGLFIKVPVEKQQAKDYRGTVQWHLQLVPRNE